MFDRTEVAARSVVRMCNAEPKAVHYHYTGGIIINGTKYPFFDIKSIDYHRDFIGAFADVITITVIMGTRDYFGAVLDNLENLEGWLAKKQIAENSILPVLGGDSSTSLYRVIAYNPPTKGVGANVGGVQEINDPDQSLTTATFQFIHKPAYDIRLSQFSGLMEMTEPAKALYMILQAQCEKYNDFTGVNPADWDVKVPRQIIIPRGTFIKDIAHYIQNEYGIYNHGIGCYIFEQVKQGFFWFVYPLFNNTRYDKEYFKATVFVVPKKYDIEDIPRTYVVDNGNLTFYTSSEASLLQNKTADQLNQGTGIQVLNPTENIGGTTKDMGPNKWYIDGQEALSTYNVIDRPDQVKNYIPIFDNTGNQAKLISSVAGNAGTYLTITWKHANPNLLQPGMPMRIHYLDGGVKILEGTLHEYHAVLVKRTNMAMIEQPYICNVVMKIFVTERT